MYFNNQGPSW